MPPASSSMPPSRPLLAVSLGDPAGIGPEVVLRAARATADARLVAVGSARVLEVQAEALGLGPVARVSDARDEPAGGTLAVLDVVPDAASVPWGEVSAEGGRQALAAIDAACDLALAGRVDGIVTAPISKASIRRAGATVPGHTEILRDRTGAETVVMVLAADLDAGPLRVALVTIHVPVADVAALVTADRVVETGRALAAALRRDLGIAAPRIAVLGLNPHAGDGGVIGREEIDALAPALRTLGADLHVQGPFPADAFFGRAAWRQFDAVLAMYHDQGLAPFKALAQGAGVNVTLGLPIVRTSPDHGTAFDLAGQGRADPASMLAAIRLAAQMARRRAGR